MDGCRLIAVVELGFLNPPCVADILRSIVFMSSATPTGTGVPETLLSSAFVIVEISGSNKKCEGCDFQSDEDGNKLMIGSYIKGMDTAEICWRKCDVAEKGWHCH